MNIKLIRYISQTSHITWMYHSIPKEEIKGNDTLPDSPTWQHLFIASTEDELNTLYSQICTYTPETIVKLDDIDYKVYKVNHQDFIKKCQKDSKIFCEVLIEPIK